MGFLSGWFVAGLAAIAAPIIFHMIRRTPSGRVPFSTLMFLEASPPTITKRSRIDHWPLLLLRALALALLAAAFMRPFFREVETSVAETETQRQIAVLLDRSASMQRAGMWDDAKLKLVDTFASANDGDQVAVYAFDNRVEPIMTFEEWKELEPETRSQVLLARVEELRPGWGSTNLGNALILAADDIESLEMDNDDQSKQRPQSTVLLISDIQQGSAIESLQNYEWPDTIELKVHQIHAPGTTNAGLELMAQSDVEADKVRVRVSNAPDSNAEEFEIQWRDSAGNSVKKPRPVYVAPGRSRIVSFETPSGAGTSKITLSGDAHEFDNALFIDRLAASKLSVLYLGDEPEGDPESLRFYLARAFPQMPSRQVTMLPPEVNTVPQPLDASISMVVIADKLKTDRMADVRKYAEAGGTVLYVAQTAEGVSSIGPLISDDQDFKAAEAEVENYAIIEQIDFEHPVFAPFADAQFADFTRINVWKHRRLPIDKMADVRVLARFDDGDPAIVEKTLGTGRIFVLATGWQPEDSQLALSTKFVPLMNNLLEQGANVPTELPRMLVGDELKLEPFRASGASQRLAVTGPEGDVSELKDDQSVFASTTIPGVYQLDAGTSSARFAVNVDPSESNTSVMALEQLESLGVKMDQGKSDPANVAAAAASERQLKTRELEKRQKLWRLLILAAICTLFIETWLAGRVASRQANAAAGGLA